MAGPSGGLGDWDRAITADFQKHSTIFISGDGWRIVEFSKDFGGQQRKGFPESSSEFLRGGPGVEVGMGKDAVAAVWIEVGDKAVPCR